MQATAPMPDPDTDPKTNPSVVKHLLDQLRRHPKRVVFTEGEDHRVIEAAARLVNEQVVAPILLGNRDRIREIAKKHNIPMTFIHVIDPPKASDFHLFCKRIVNMDRYRTMQLGKPEDLVSRPHYFGALMVQYGQADAVIGGNQALPASYFRALIQMIKPVPTVPKIFAVTILMGNHLNNLGGSQMLFLADSGLIPNPTVDELAAIAIETGKLAQHILGRKPVISLLSHSTKGSARTADALRMAAAAALANAESRKLFLDFDIDGELQADVAVDPSAAEIKIPSSDLRNSADVLVFPNLDAAHISVKLLQHVAGAQNYGHLIKGLSRPAAQIPRTASVETIFGTAAAVAVEAIKSHELYPDGEV